MIAFSVQYDEQVGRHEALNVYLLAEQQAAVESFERELDRKDDDFTRFWRYAGLPIKPSHLALDTQQLQDAKLLDPKSIGIGLDAKHVKEVLRPAEVFEFNDACAAPHYLAQTQTILQRSRQRAKLVASARARIDSSPKATWAKLPEARRKELLKANHVRQKKNSVKMNGVFAHLA